MATKRVAKVSQVPTTELLRLTLLGSNGTTRQKNAADSLRSVLALNLRNAVVVIPSDMEPHLKELLKLTTNSK